MCVCVCLCVCTFVCVYMCVCLCVSLLCLAPPGAGASSDGSPIFDTPVMVDGVPHLPFQLQTEYTGMDGSKLLRVVTKLKPITQERETAEKGNHLKQL